MVSCIVRKGILRKKGTITHGRKSRLETEGESNTQRDPNDITSLFGDNKEGESNEFDPDLSYENRMSIRQISDNESPDEDDGKFVPSNYAEKSEDKAKKNKRRFRIAIKKKQDLPKPIEDDREENDYVPEKYRDMEKGFRPSSQPLQEEKYQESLINKPNQSYTSIPSFHEPRESSEYKGDSNTYSGYLPETESIKKPSVKQLTHNQSEMSVRDADDDYISASAEEDANTDSYSRAIDQAKKTVTFQKMKGATSKSNDSNELTEDDKEFTKSLASVQDFTNLGSV